MNLSDSTKQLFTNKRYDSKAQLAAQKISLQTTKRYSQWLVNMKYVVEQSNVDSLLSQQGQYSDPTSNEEKHRVTEIQRDLLDCERQKVVERIEKIEEQQMMLDMVVKNVSVTTERLMLEKLQEMKPEQLFQDFPDYGHFSSFAYSASLSFSRLGSLATESPSLTSNVLDLVSNDSFCNLLGKYPKNTDDPKVAIGFIGIDNCKKLFPVLMAKPLLKWSDKNTRLIAPKLWQHAVVMANVTRMRLDDANYKEPDEGVLIGMVRACSYFAICNLFSQVFEEALTLVMRRYIADKQTDEYDLCSEVSPTLSVLPNVLFKLDKTISRKVVDYIEWGPRAVHLKNALLEDIEEVPILERSLHGVALGQAKAFSIYDLMKQSNAFVDKHAPFWFANVQMDGGAIKEVVARSPGKLTLSM
ncbi:HDOD domain-containing protein [Vibrio sp. MACH09]|uniref:HDOD domain-containing protein n=1 Tax=Vibrio sp. MACH09 TaxID=3025122 RepID=UPI00295E970A|nr:HDOD domain-containing protein [Vibrio sp. MACH09]